jgi:hypothetical protein
MIKRYSSEGLEYLFIVLKYKQSIEFVKGENGFPLQATCFPVGERRAASSATAPFRGLACLAIPRESSSLPLQSIKMFLVSKGFPIK